MSDTQKVTLGDTEYPIQRFRGLKAILMMSAITRVARDVPDIMAKASKGFQTRNTIIVTEAMSRLPRWSGFTEEDFDAAAKANGGRREIELPDLPSQQDQLLGALPDLLEGPARREVLRMLALLIVPHDKLMDADEDDKWTDDDGTEHKGGVEELLDNYRRAVLYEATLDQLVELGLVSQQVINDQMSPKQKEQLGKMFRSLMKNWQDQRRSTQAPVMTDREMEELTSQTPPQESPISSTDSPTPTDGLVEQPSTVSPG